MSLLVVEDMLVRNNGRTIRYSKSRYGSAGIISNNQEFIPEYHEKMLDTRDLNTQNTRLLVLRNNLDNIVGRLRDSLCLDVRENTFAQSMKQLTEAIESED